MSVTWQGPPPPPSPQMTWRHWLRVLMRGVPVALITFGGLAVHLAIRLVERVIFGPKRPWTPHITRAVCQLVLVLLGLRVTKTGVPLQGAGVMVSNHVSWLDIYVLNACHTLVFIAKSEVAGWPGIGWLARATGTVFIRRARGRASEHAEMLRARLQQGERLMLFAEGTSTDGRRVLPFRSSLFAPVLDAGLPCQPVSLVYHAPVGADERFYGWWGDMGFGPSLIKVLGTQRQGRVELVFHPPLASDAYQRKALALTAEVQVRKGVEAVLGSLSIK